MNDLTKFLNQILNTFQIDLGVFNNSHIEKTIKKRLEILQLQSINDYLKYIRNNKDEINELFQLFYNGYSSFLRERITFQTIELVVIPNIIDKMKEGQELRIWSVGCSNGQEPYSLAILCEEAKKNIDSDFKYRIFGTDISDTALIVATKGEYKESDIENVSLGNVKKYFKKTKMGYRVNKVIRDNVSFSRFDIIHDKGRYPSESIFGNFDIICCCNVLIYYNEDVQNDIVNKLTGALKDNSYLVTSLAEKDQVHRTSKLTEIACSTAIFKK